MGLLESLIDNPARAACCLFFSAVETTAALSVAAPGLLDNLSTKPRVPKQLVKPYQHDDKTLMHKFWALGLRDFTYTGHWIFRMSGYGVAGSGIRLRLACG